MLLVFTCCATPSAPNYEDNVEFSQGYDGEEGEEPSLFFEAFTNIGKFD